jgi:hypothetical protein
MALPQKKQETANVAHDAIEALIIKGDLAALTPEQRVIHYKRVCDSIGVNPLTQPFQYMTLQGKLILYATRSCADQLRKLHGIDIEVVSQDAGDDLLTVHVRAKDKTGRVDEDLGAVPFPNTLRGEARSNQILKCVTKAKRRVTLSICGLGYLDETEVESIPGAEKVQPEVKNIMRPAELSTGTRIDRETGEIIEPAAPEPAVTEAADAAPPVDTPSGGAAPLSIQDRAREAASRGAEPARELWRKATGEEREALAAIIDEINALISKAEEGNVDGR